jgi:Spy/CpxP family protein refolding chaperone
MTIGTIAALLAATTTAGLGLVANHGATLDARPQDGGSCHGRMGMGRHLGNALGMTEAQKERAKLLHDEAKSAREKIVKDGSLDEQAKRARLEALREQTMNRFREILTADQRKLLEEKRAKFEKARAERKAAFEKALGLSDAQKEQLKALRDEMKDKFGKLGDRESARAAVESLKQRMDAVLTPEQRAKLDAMRKERRGEFGHRGRGRRHGTPLPPLGATSA